MSTALQRLTAVRKSEENTWVKPEALNDRGKFVRTDMQTRKLKAADMQKLKAFPGGTQQK